MKKTEESESRSNAGLSNAPKTERRRWLTPVAAIHKDRLRLVERNIGVPVRVAYLVLIAVVFFVPSGGLVEPNEALSNDVVDAMLYPDAVERVRALFVVYAALNVLFAGLLFLMDRVSYRLVQYAVFTMALLDALFLAALSLLESALPYWLFVILVLRNAASISDAFFQAALNVCVSLLYLAAAFLNLTMSRIDEWASLGEAPSSGFFALRFGLLLILGFCASAVQALYDRQGLLERERKELARRDERLKGIGRLTAEVAHQLKNPLGVINNAAFTIGRHAGEPEIVSKNADLIRQTVQRSDQILIGLMDFARLNEGRIEKVDIAKEAREVLARVAPQSAFPNLIVDVETLEPAPTVLMQRSHLVEILDNLILNAREAMEGSGRLSVFVGYDDHANAVIHVEDDGPGVPDDCLGRVFEAFFTTKSGGAGLGLGIVRKNAELYGGRVRVSPSRVGGACFSVTLPERSPDLDLAT